MRYRWMSALCAAPLLALADCGPVVPSPGGPEPDPDARAFGRAIVLDGEDLDAHTTNLLTALRRRISGMQVSYSPAAGACPSVVLRSRKSIFGDNSPIVYVDGARAANTCVLDQLQPSDVSRIEVYLQGITPRSGYESHANGLILVFMRTGET
jgi:outer membrane cobalamin receptor